MNVIAFTLSRLFSWWGLGVTPWVILGCDQANINRALVCCTVGALCNEVCNALAEEDESKKNYVIFGISIVLTAFSIIPAVIGWWNVVLMLGNSQWLQNIIGAIR